MLEKGGGLVEVDLNEIDEEVGTNGEGTAPDDFVEERLHDGCFESEEVLFAEGCGHGVSESGGCREELWQTR